MEHKESKKNSGIFSKVYSNLHALFHPGAMSKKIAAGDITEVLYDLVEVRRDINTLYNGSTVLFLSILHKKPKLTYELIALGADPNIAYITTRGERQTPLELELTLAGRRHIAVGLAAHGAISRKSYYLKYYPLLQQPVELAAKHFKQRMYLEAQLTEAEEDIERAKLHNDIADLWELQAKEETDKDFKNYYSIKMLQHRKQANAYLAKISEELEPNSPHDDDTAERTPLMRGSLKHST
jgi:hypothetical protein